MRAAKPWFDQADYDLKTAEAMFRTRRYQYVVFMVHLALEKILKGLVSQVAKRMPPRSHDLLYLAELAHLELPLQWGGFFQSLNRQALEARYPTGQVEFTRKLAQEVLQQAQEAFTWLQGHRVKGEESPGGPSGRSSSLRIAADTELTTLITDFIQKLGTHGINVQKAVLFGSYANGWPRPSSDIDIAVISDDFRGLSGQQRIELVAKVTCTGDHRLAPLAYTLRQYRRASPMSFLGEIKRTGRVVYRAT